MKIYYSFAFSAALLVCSGLTSFAQSPNYQSPCSQLIWEDNFDGTTLDASKWTPQTGDGCPSLCGWGNSEAQYYTDRTENLKVEGGNLVITSLKENYGGKGYTSARIRSYNKGDFTFGRMVARIKLPQGAGSWSAFWLLPTDEVYGPWAGSGEIDIMEYQGHSPGNSSGTIHYGGVWPDNKYKGSVYTLSSSQKFYDDFHEFAIEWDSTEIRWYVDNVHFVTRSKQEIAPSFWPFHERFHIILNNAIGGHLGGAINDAFFPQQMLVDYVRVYSAPLNRPLHGKRNMIEGDVANYYIVGDAGDVTYQWTVPSNATILSGQGTNSISVQWNDEGQGEVQLHLITGCDDFDLSYAVNVFENTCMLVYNDYDTEQNILYAASSGTMATEVVNPSTVGNSSPKVGRYIRSGNAKDSLVYSDLINQNYGDFESGDKNFYLDVYTQALPGTRIELQLRNHDKSLAGASANAGSRSSFVTYTSVQNQWQTLKFNFVSVNDATVQLSEVDNIVLYFDPELINTTSSLYRRFYIDDFRHGLIDAADMTGDLSPDCNETGVVYHVDQVSGSTYFWEVPPGAFIASGQSTNEITVNWGTTSGNVSVVETTSACADISSQQYVTLSSGCPTPVTQSASTRGVKVFPNPASSTVTIESPIQNYELVIVNAMGEKVYSQKYSDGRKIIVNVDAFMKGVYLMQMITETEVVQQKLILE